MKINMYARLLKYKENGFTLGGQYRRHIPLMLFRLIVILAVIYSDLFLPLLLPNEVIFLFVGIVVGAQIQEFIWIYKHYQTWNLLVDSTDWEKVETKSKCN